MDWDKFLYENDEAAFSRIYKNCVSELYSYGISLGFPSELCMDAIQEIFYKLYVQTNRLTHVSNIRFYLFRSFKNQLIDIQKKRKIILPIENSEHRFMMEISVEDSFTNEEERSLLKQKVEELLQVLTDRQHEAIYLRYMQNMEYAEISTIMDMHPESVRKLVYRAMQAIRKSAKNSPFSLLFLLSHLFDLH